MKHRAKNKIAKFMWGGQVWTCDHTFREYPPEFVATYSCHLEPEPEPKPKAKKNKPDEGEINESR